MSEEPKQTFSAREIVLEFFPETNERFIPKHLNYSLSNHKGQFVLINRQDKIMLKLEPISPSGDKGSQLCCDFCQQSAAREYLQIFRAEHPESNGRRFFYVSLCRNTQACELRRLSDKPIEKLLARAGVKN